MQTKKGANIFEAVGRENVSSIPDVPSFDSKFLLFLQRTIMSSIKTQGVIEAQEFDHTSASPTPINAAIYFSGPGASTCPHGAWRARDRRRPRAPARPAASGRARPSAGTPPSSPPAPPPSPPSASSPRPPRRQGHPTPNNPKDSPRIKQVPQIQETVVLHLRQSPSLSPTPTPEPTLVPTLPRG